MNNDAAIYRAQALAEQGKLLEAEVAISRVLAKSPMDVRANHVMTFVSTLQGNRPRALYYAERAFKIDSRNPTLRNNYAAALCGAGRLQEGADVLLAAREAPGLDMEGYASLTRALAMLSDYPSALRYAYEGIERYPKSSSIACNLAFTLQWLGRAQEGLAVWRQARDLDPANLVAASGVLMCCNYVDDVPVEQAVADQRAFADALTRLFGPPQTGWLVDPDPNRRLRVALVTPDMTRHPVSYFTEGLLRNYSRDEWHLTCYGTGAEDDRTAVLKRLFDTWRSETTTSPAALAAKIREDRTDVLIDLAGHTAGGRLETLHLRPAPVQISGIGYPGSTGLPSVGWRLTDRHVDPPDQLWACAERPLRLEPCFQCYMPPTNAPEPAPSTDTPENECVFGTFSAPQKWSDSTVRLWAAVLEAVPGSRLLIRNTGLRTAGAREMIASRLVGAGAKPESLRIEGPVPTARDVLLQYARVDISVDTFPYHGTTTACESLWMGVPIVVLKGRTSAARVGCSVLENVGLSELIARTPEEYIAIVKRLAADRSRLRGWRSSGAGGLRALMAASTLCDGPNYARRVQGAVRGLWREWCAGKMPDGHV